MIKEKFKIGLGSLERLLEPKTPPLIGVDVSSSSVKLVELSDLGKGRIGVERYAIEPLPRDAVVDGNIMNLEAVTEALSRGWKRMGTRIKNVALAVPAAAVITKKITVPAGQREEDLEIQVETEANQYIPFALDEVNLDFQVLGPAPNSPEDIEVLIAASRKDKVDDRVAVAEAAGLKALIMDVDSYAIQTALEFVRKQLPEGGADQVIALVGIGAALMNINVFRNDQALYNREQPFGGSQLTQDIQQRYNLTPEEAEVAKRSGGLPDDYRTEVLQPFIETCALEVARALQFFFTSSEYTQVDYVVLAGGSAALPGIAEAVAHRVQSRALVANPFAAMTPSSKIKLQQLTADAPALMVACGLAMRGFDP